ncbi:MAG: hypothetical protein IKS31_00255 [Clostridia bacterium]|nr:hypothetical protein [Clostridia bacterium]
MKENRGWIRLTALLCALLLLPCMIAVRAEEIPAEFDSTAGACLQTFLDAWKLNDFDGMAACCSPGWQASLPEGRNAQAALFMLIGMYTLTDDTLLGITGAETDPRRTALVQASVGSRMRAETVGPFLITLGLVLEEERWYMDPDAIRFYEEYTEPKAVSAPEYDTPEACLQAFMDHWTDGDLDGMVWTCANAWDIPVLISGSLSHTLALAALLENRQIFSYEVESIEGRTETGKLTATVSAVVGHYGSAVPPKRYGIAMLLLRQGETTWGVDPRSLRFTEREETGETLLPATDSLLYFNPYGGRYYHADPYCPSVADLYLPLEYCFLYRQLGEVMYAHLVPCTVCGAPPRTETTLPVQTPAPVIPQSKPTQPPTPPPAADDSTVLYFNPKGGRYYHADPNCPSISERYLPLHDSFTYRELREGRLGELHPCPVCGAPGLY